MVKSKLPLEQRIFIPRRSPTVLILADMGAVPGPFCVNCGNPASIHREGDNACPVRRLHPAYPDGAREICNCGSASRSKHRPDCNVKRYGFNGTVTV